MPAPFGPTSPIRSPSAIEASMASRITNVPTSRVTPDSRRMLIGPVCRIRNDRCSGRGPSRRGGPFRSLGPCPCRGTRGLVRCQPDGPLPAQFGPTTAAPPSPTRHRPQDRRRALPIRGAKPLAPRAEMRRARADDDPLDRPPATRTRLAGPLVDLQVLLHRAVAVGCGVVVDRAAATHHGLGQDPSHFVIEVALVGRSQCARRSAVDGGERPIAPHRHRCCRRRR